MTIGLLTERPGKTLDSRTVTRFAIAFIILDMVISSPILILINTAQVLAVSVNDNANRIDSSGYHSTPSIPSAAANSPLSSPTPMVPAATNLENNGDFITQAALSGVSARQTNNIVGAQSYYDVVFNTATTGTIKFIDITFPAGTLIGVAPLLVEAEGIGAGSAAKTSATVIRYTVTNAVSVPAGTEVRLEFFNVVNPTAPSTGYKVTVTTRNAGGTAIDGPTLSNGMNMKQIGTDQIADGAVTSAKPAESFMKRVTLMDNAAGNARGWNPDGVTTDFTIAEPVILDSTLVSINLKSGNNVCSVDDNSISDVAFGIKCTTAPSGGVELHYVVENLPSHVVS